MCLYKKEGNFNRKKNTKLRQEFWRGLSWAFWLRSATILDLMAFASLAQVQKVLCALAYWVEETWQDVCNMRSEMAALHQELDRVRALVAHMEKQAKCRDLTAQEALLREAETAVCRVRVAGACSGGWPPPKPRSTP